MYLYVTRVNLISNVPPVNFSPILNETISTTLDLVTKRYTPGPGSDGRRHRGYWNNLHF